MSAQCRAFPLFHSSSGHVISVSFVFPASPHSKDYKASPRLHSKNHTNFSLWKSTPQINPVPRLCSSERTFLTLPHGAHPHKDILHRITGDSESTKPLNIWATSHFLLHPRLISNTLTHPELTSLPLCTRYKLHL